MKPYIVILYFLVVLSKIVCGSSSVDTRGVFIKSYPYPDQERSSLIINNGEYLKLSEETTLSFWLKPREEFIFGRILHIISDKEDMIDLSFTSVGEGVVRCPMLIVNKTIKSIDCSIVPNQWIYVELDFSKDRNQITLKYANKEVSVPYFDSGATKIKLCFGISTFDRPIIPDIASVNIKDITIFKNNKPYNHWSLQYHKESISYDTINQLTATVVNPIWLSDIYSTWTKECKWIDKGHSMTTFDPQSDDLYIVPNQGNDIFVCNLSTKQELSLHSKYGCPASTNPNMLLYDRFNNRLISYNLDNSKESYYSFDNSSWSENINNYGATSYWNNSISYYNDKSLLVSFGGYGLHRYNNEIIIKDLNAKTIKKNVLAEISPRFSPSTVIVGSTLYIFGGRGSNTGRQEVNVKNYYDLYSVDLLTLQVSKLWEIESSEDFYDMKPCENLIYNEKEDCFYILTTFEGGTLFRFSKNKNTLEMVSFSIYEDLNWEYVYTNLYKSANEEKLYFVVNKLGKDTKSEQAVYSINYPPITINNELVGSSEKPYSLTKISVVCVVIFLFIVICIVLWLRKRRYVKDHKQSSNISTVAIEYPENQTPTTVDYSKKSVCFIGGFKVLDAEGNDITLQFTPTLKYLLVLLIVNTQKDPKGISTHKLQQILWFDKDDVAARNNRNVYFSKLRILTEQVGNMEILNVGGFLSVKFNEVKCDYVDIFDLLEKQPSSEINNADLENLLYILSKGEMLPNIEEEWIDNYKSHLTTQIIELLSMISLNATLSDRIKMKIADIIFIHDNINERALFIKCSTLYEAGKKGTAKNIYENFAKEYNMVIGEKFRYGFMDIIEGKNIRA